MTTIAPNEAVKIAYEYLLSLSGAAASSYTNYRIEEMSDSDTGKEYKITLSYDVSGEFPFEKHREYKAFLIKKEGNKDSSSVVWMKIHKI